MGRPTYAIEVPPHDACVTATCALGLKDLTLDASPRNLRIELGHVSIAECQMQGSGHARRMLGLPGTQDGSSPALPPEHPADCNTSNVRASAARDGIHTAEEPLKVFPGSVLIDDESVLCEGTVLESFKAWILLSKPAISQKPSCQHPITQEFNAMALAERCHA
mmetsp:Transcript_24550/g.70569  ORF Transcript_24550/g.70569 Transcript_24550/m.70569 type:complete len:164 (+) Transcript_24550:255-746(+)